MPEYDDLVKKARDFCIHTPLSKPVITKLADAIEAPTAEQCAVVKPLEWEKKTFRHEANDGLYMCDYDRPTWDAWLLIGPERRLVSGGPFSDANEAKAAAQADYEQRIRSAINLRPASEVRAEAHAAAIEAAKTGVRKHMDQNCKTTTEFMGKWIIDDLEKLHTDASLAAIERIKRDARKEALFDAMKVCCRGDIVYADSAAKHINYLISLEDKNDQT